MSDAGADAGFIAASKHRVAVVRRLYESPALPRQLKEDTGRQYSRVSEALNSLRNKDLVELRSPEERKKGRLYSLTESGKEAWEFMQETDMIE